MLDLPFARFVNKQMKLLSILCSFVLLLKLLGEPASMFLISTPSPLLFSGGKVCKLIQSVMVRLRPNI